MHNLLEWFVQHELKLPFQYLVKDCISLDTLSERIQNFIYVYSERKNRPSGVRIDDSSKDLGFLRNTPLIFRDLVDTDNGYWNLILLLIQIVNIVFSPVVTQGMTYFLKHFISDHHNLFKSMFPERRLIPKHHLMIHYPRCIRKVGPLIHVVHEIQKVSTTFSRRR